METKIVRVTVRREPVADLRRPRRRAQRRQHGLVSALRARRQPRALNLYGATGARFGEDAQLIGEAFATYAAIALAGARHDRQLNGALASRDAIGQAKGLLMAREQLTGQQAFDLLVPASQDANIKLTEVATWLIDEHEHPIPAKAAGLATNSAHATTSSPSSPGRPRGARGTSGQFGSGSRSGARSGAARPVR